MTSPGFCPTCGMAAGEDALRCPHCGVSLPADRGAHDPRRVARGLADALGPGYEVVDELGRGGFALVFKVHDIALDRLLAAKVIAPELTYSAGATERFRREALTVARLVHPNIVPIYFVPASPELVCYVMPLVAGESLAARLQREGALPLAVAVSIAQDIAGALDAAHAAGVVHRDVKPDNILLETQSGRALLTDFGIARGAGADSRLTTSGQVLGTPLYMAPEQAAGESEVDGRSDVYALGVVVFEMLAGRPPFEAHSAQALYAMHVAAQCPDVRQWRPEVSPSLAAALERALAKAPEDRFATAGAFAEALSAGMGRRSLRASGVTLLERVGTGDVALFRTTTAALVPDALAGVAAAQELGALRDALAASEQAVARGVRDGDAGRVRELVAALAAAARDARPAFKQEIGTALQSCAGDSALVELLARAWAQAPPGGQAPLENALGALVPGAGTALLSLARRERRAELVLLADRIGALGEAEALALVRDPSPGIAGLLLGVLVESQRPPETVERWLAAAVRHPNQQVRRSAFAAAAQRGGALAERLGRLGLRDQDPGSRLAALESLGASRRKEAVPDLAAVLGGNSQDEQVRAAEALGVLGVREAVAPLEKALSRKHVWPRGASPVEAAALGALARIPHPEAAAALGRLAARSGPAGDMARQALERLKRSAPEAG